MGLRPKHLSPNRTTFGQKDQDFRNLHPRKRKIQWFPPLPLKFPTGPLVGSSTNWIECNRSISIRDLRAAQSRKGHEIHQRRGLASFWQLRGFFFSSEPWARSHAKLWLSKLALLHLLLFAALEVRNR